MNVYGGGTACLGQEINTQGIISLFPNSSCGYNNVPFHNTALLCVPSVF